MRKEFCNHEGTERDPCECNFKELTSKEEDFILLRKNE